MRDWMGWYWIGLAGALVAAPILACTGRRFNKDWRHGITWRHRAVYAVCTTFIANGLADALAPWIAAGRS